VSGTRCLQVGMFRANGKKKTAPRSPRQQQTPNASKHKEKKRRTRHGTWSSPTRGEMLHGNAWLKKLDDHHRKEKGSSESVGTEGAWGGGVSSQQFGMVKLSYYRNIGDKRTSNTAPEKENTSQRDSTSGKSVSRVERNESTSRV